MSFNISIEWEHANNIGSLVLGEIGIMGAVKITSTVYYVGSIDWDRRLFDELIPLPQGTSYNAYLVKGDKKTALIDTVDPSKEHEIIRNLKHLEIENIDYLVSNHAEQDHSGAIPRILEIYPDAKVVTNPKCKNMLKTHLLIPEEKFITVQDRETLSLGDKTLEFIYAPWVHWPETMFTYLHEERILFSCDFLGSHLATSELFVTDMAEVYTAAKRYYAEIMMPFRTVIKSNLEKIRDLDIGIVAASHGPLYNNPKLILDAYREWISDNVKNEVLIPYVSMHGSIRRMVDYFVDALIKRGITVKPFNLTRTDLGELAIALVDAATIVIASPALLVGPHPQAVYATYLVKALRPKTRHLSLIGSYGWGSQLAEQITGMLAPLKAEFLEPVVIEGHPRLEDFQALDKLADRILQKHKSLNLQ
ncbi:FprA family A-type flavoprotein [[Eubacterium] cellulosolvens]